jgi:nitroimidazol reductase NimA-like FMN-containing flavoprotein (pyridoxamine 5'-phosphate oxidase superfamily)
MLDIYEMGSKEIQDLLQQVGYGHLGCTREGHPYVVPMHYYLEDSDIYIFTTEGQKTKYINANPEVCLQVEEVHDRLHWRSVIVTGRAERLTEQQDIDHAMQFVKERNPTLSPAINRTWLDAWGRANVIAIYRIHPSEITGNKTSE